MLKFWQSFQLQCYCCSLRIFCFIDIIYIYKKNNIICIEVDRFKTEIIRAFSSFITAPVPKLLHETLGLKGVIGHPGPKLNWSVLHLRPLVLFLNLMVSGIGAQRPWDPIPLHLGQHFIWSMNINIEMLRNVCFLFWMPFIYFYIYIYIYIYIDR